MSTNNNENSNGAVCPTSSLYPMTSQTSSKTTNKFEKRLEEEALEEVCLGIILAELAITDNQPGTLKKVAKASPWHLEALKTITGCEQQCLEPLERILQEDLQLTLDFEIDVSGITKGGHFLDTQGYIAHNEEIVVVSFRCSTTAYDWMTNFNMTNSAWEIPEDLELGYSGCCSGFADFFCTRGKYKPRVHTGFYNNLLAVLPDIQTHVEPLLLDPDQPPRKLYVVGHSLGGAIATLTACYFLTEYDWNSETLRRHRLVVVTAGSPRACCTSMKDVIDERRQALVRPHEQYRMYRVVKGRDLVARVPPKGLGFCHLVDPIKITDQGEIVLRTKEDDPETDLLELTSYRNFHFRAAENDLEDAPNLSCEKSSDTGNTLGDLDQWLIDCKTKYGRKLLRTPKALRDHAPDFYLKPFLKRLGKLHGSLRDEQKQPACNNSIQGATLKDMDLATMSKLDDRDEDATELETAIVSESSDENCGDDNTTHCLFPVESR